MSTTPNVVWLNASPSLRWVDQPLLRHLARHRSIAHWEYIQSLDEASALNTAVELLHQYITTLQTAQDHQIAQDQISQSENQGKVSQQNGKSNGSKAPNTATSTQSTNTKATNTAVKIHLVGHGISGVVGLLYARRFPEHVRSLALLSVAAQPAATWHSHYYVQRQLFPYSRARLLAQTVGSLFGETPPHLANAFINALERDLEASPQEHSLFRLSNLAKGGIEPPLLIGSSYTDPIASPEILCDWQKYLKSSDALWVYPKGRHFFHYFFPQAVSDRLSAFWQASEQVTKQVTDHSTEHPTEQIPQASSSRLPISLKLSGESSTTC